jgi:hypothetical protein
MTYQSARWQPPAAEHDLRILGDCSELLSRISSRTIPPSQPTFTITIHPSPSASRLLNISFLRARSQYVNSSPRPLHLVLNFPSESCFELGTTPAAGLSPIHVPQPRNATLVHVQQALTERSRWLSDAVLHLHQTERQPAQPSCLPWRAPSSPQRQSRRPTPARCPVRRTKRRRSDTSASSATAPSAGRSTGRDMRGHVSVFCFLHEAPSRGSTARAAANTRRSRSGLAGQMS